MRSYESPDGTLWKVDVRIPGSSNAMVVFRHPDGRTARNDRYNWYLATAREAKSLTEHLDSKSILATLTSEQLALLFRRSMLISAADSPLDVPVTQAG